MTVYDYIADKNPESAWAILSRADRYLEKPDTPGEMSNLLAQFVDQGGEDALLALADIHPDRELIGRSFVMEKDSYQNASGGGCGCQHSNIQGPQHYPPYYQANGQREGNEDKLITLLIGGSLMLLVTTFALKQL